MKQSLLRPFRKIWILFILFVLLACPGCGSVQKELSDSLGLDIRGGTVLLDRDSHGGFHGDGDRFISLHFPDQSIADELSSNKNWKSLPLSKNLTGLVYGLTTETAEEVHTAGPYLTDEDGKPLFPEIKNGYYYFLDRQSEHGDMHDDTQVLKWHSMNFTIAIYDADSDTLYYGEFDS